MRAVLQNQDTRVPTEVKSGFGISSKPPNSGRLATLLGFLGDSGACSFRKKIRNLRFSNCWKCTEIINPTITNVIFVSFKIFYDPIRRTFLAPGGRCAHPTHPPPPPCLRAWPAVNSVKRGKAFVIQTLDKVDPAVRVTLLPETTFLLVNKL